MSLKARPSRKDSSRRRKGIALQDVSESEHGEGNTVQLAFKAGCRGDGAMTSGDFKGAIQSFTEALSYDSDDAVSLAKRSECYFKLGQFEEAVADGTKCIELKPLYIKGYQCKAAALMELKNYNDAVETYCLALLNFPEDADLQEGMAVAKQKKSVNDRLAVSRKTRQSMRAAKAQQNSIFKAANVSSFLTQTKTSVDAQIEALQKQRSFLEDLAKMDLKEKSNLLFGLIDADGSGAIDAEEMAAAQRKQNHGLSFAKSMEDAIDAIAAVDQNGDAELDPDEFLEFVHIMARHKGLETTPAELCEFMAFQIIFGDDDSNNGRDGDNEVVDMEKVVEEVKEREELNHVLASPKLRTLFALFDKDHDGSVSFTEVACGLYHLTRNLEASIKTTTDLLLMLDKDDSRTLDYDQFGKLIVTIAHSTENAVDQVVKDLTTSMKSGAVKFDEDTMRNIRMADADYARARDRQKRLTSRRSGRRASVGGGSGGSGKDVDALSYTKAMKVFDLWDLDKDGTIDSNELMKGLEAYDKNQKHQNKSSIDVDRAAEIFMRQDSNNDMLLDRDEFVLAISDYAKTEKKPLVEVIDMICMVTTSHQRGGARRARRSTSMASGAAAAAPASGRPRPGRRSTLRAQ